MGVEVTSNSKDESNSMKNLRMTLARSLHSLAYSMQSRRVHLLASFVDLRMVDCYPYTRRTA